MISMDVHWIDALRSRFMAEAALELLSLVTFKFGRRTRAIPAPDPAASRGTSLLFLLRKTLPRARAQERPISTLGPSGPREQPVPRVIAAAPVLRKGAIA